MHRFSKLKKYNRILSNQNDPNQNDYFNDFSSPFKITKLRKIKNENQRKFPYFSQRELQTKKEEISFNSFTNIKDVPENEYNTKMVTPRNAKTRQMKKREIIQRISKNISKELNRENMNNILTNSSSIQEHTSFLNDGDNCGNVDNLTYISTQK